MLRRFRVKDRESCCAQRDRTGKGLDRADGEADSDLGGRVHCPLMDRAR